MAAFTPGDEQREVTRATDPVLLVVGGAGTGKTTTAAAAARAHLELRDAECAAASDAFRGPRSQALDRVLFLSFSRASVARIIERSHTILGAYRDRVEVITFHALAWRFVQRYASVLDLDEPYLMSEAQAKLFKVPAALRYTDLVPKALEILDVPAVKQHITQRWSLVICDEYQDTDDSQSTLLATIRGPARLLLLADPNQCIYASLPGTVGVGPERLEAARSLPGVRQINLPEASYRDPSGVLPAAAAAIRTRDFFHPSVAAALSSGRLQVRSGLDPDHEAQVVAEVVEELLAKGHTVGVFSHHNDALARLSDQLVEQGIGHEVAGLSESLGASLDAQLMMAQFAASTVEWNTVLQYLAIFVTSAVRGKQAPELAWMILGRRTAPAALETRLAALQTQLTGLNPAQALKVAEGAHSALGLPSKRSAWGRASKMLRPMLAASTRGTDGRATADGVLTRLKRLVDNRRVGLLTENAAETESPVQLMGLYQTKGREADATVVILRSSDFFGCERTEPFEEGSRLLYVVFTRARHRTVTLILGKGLPDLVRPLTALTR